MYQPPPGFPPGGYARPLAARPVSAMDALRFAFGSPDWGMNLLLGMVFMLIPVVGPLALHGWHCEIHQRLARRHPQPIPKLDFNDFTHYLERGIGPFVVNLVIGLPLFFVAYIYIVVSVVLVAALSEGSREPVAAVAVGLVLAVIGLGINMFVAVLLSAGLTRAELSEQIGWSLSPGAIWSYGARTWARYIGASLRLAPLALGALVVGAMLLCLGFYPAIVAVQLAVMHLRWQVYEAQLAEGGEAMPLRPAAALPSETRGAPPPPRYY